MSCCLEQEDEHLKAMRQAGKTMREYKQSKTLFSTSISAPYDIRFTTGIRTWLAGVVDITGAGEQEKNALCLAVDEVLGFFISSYPDEDLRELLQVSFHLASDGLATVTIKNAGPPMRPDRIPTFDPQTPENSDMGGLWYFLARESVDTIEFHNLGMGGWRAELCKRLTCSSFACNGEEGETKTRNQVSSRDLRLRMARPEDAAALVALTYDTYRYSYPAPDFYYEDRLRAALESGELVSLVVDTGGEIVGNTSLSISQNSPKSMYLSTLMVARSYRSSRVMTMLLEGQEQYMRENPPDVELFHLAMVTAHAASQKIAGKLGFSPLALLLNVGAMVDYRGMADPGAGRESFVTGVRFASGPHLKTLFIPAPHHEVMAPLLAQSGCVVELSNATDEPTFEHTVMRVEEDKVESWASVLIVEMGTDWARRLRKKVFALTSSGIAAVSILIPAWKPAPENLEQQLSSLNAVFSGIKPLSGEEFYLAYSVMTGAVDFERIHLADPLANILKEHIRNTYADMLEDE